ncbi:MAG: hypothetical protein J6T39_01275 [Clostridia bacterium]|nr:hypothetical protein [Clostridia bacterium]
MEEFKNITTDEIIKNFEVEIEEKTEKLKLLLKEKKELMAEYKSANPAQKVIIEKNMINSKNKFEDLSKQVDELTKKIAKFKKQNNN